MDQTAVLQKAETNNGFVTVAVLKAELGWEPQRSSRALDQLIKDGLAWIDDQFDDGGKAFWIPSIFSSFAI